MDYYISRSAVLPYRSSHKHPGSEGEFIRLINHHHHHHHYHHHHHHQHHHHHDLHLHHQLHEYRIEARVIDKSWGLDKSQWQFVLSLDEEDQKPKSTLDLLLNFGAEPTTTADDKKVDGAKENPEAVKMKEEQKLEPVDKSKEKIKNKTANNNPGYDNDVSNNNNNNNFNVNNSAIPKANKNESSLENSLDQSKNDDDDDDDDDDRHVDDYGNDAGDDDDNDSFPFYLISDN